MVILCDIEIEVNNSRKQSIAYNNTRVCMRPEGISMKIKLYLCIISSYLCSKRQQILKCVQRLYDTNLHVPAKLQSLDDVLSFDEKQVKIFQNRPTIKTCDVCRQKRSRVITQVIPGSFRYMQCKSSSNSTSA